MPEKHPKSSDSAPEHKEVEISVRSWLYDQVWGALVLVTFCAWRGYEVTSTVPFVLAGAYILVLQVLHLQGALPWLNSMRPAVHGPVRLGLNTALVLALCGAFDAVTGKL